MPSPRHQSLDLRLRRRGLAYARELESVLDGVLASLLPELIREVQRNPNVKTDALWGFGDWLAKVAKATRGALSDRTLISRIKRQAAALDHMTVNELAGALAIDPTKIPGVPHIAESFVLRNAGLVRSLTDTYLDGVESVLREAQPGVRAGSLIAQIAERAQVTRRRARLIAVNETLTYHAETNRARQQRLGVAHYEWSASMDERTRPWHRDLDGQVFAWSDPPVGGGTGKTDRGHPGDGILCRCVAVPRVDVSVPPAPSAPDPAPQIPAAADWSTVRGLPFWAQTPAYAGAEPGDIRKFERHIQAVFNDRADPQTLNMIGEAGSGTQGYTTSSKWTSSEELLDQQADIQAPDGEYVGRMTRRFRRDGDGHLVAYHRYFELDEGHQSRGIGRAILRDAIIGYRRLGVDRIELDAHWIGRYNWAKLGWEWRPEVGDEMRHRFRDWLQRRGHPPALADTWTTARELSQLETPDGVRIGKDFLLDEDTPTWEGDMDLRNNAQRRILLEGLGLDDDE